MGLWSSARFVLALVSEVLQQLALGEHGMICADTLLEANVWMINWSSRVVLIDDHRDLSGLMENLGEADYWWVILIPGRFLFLGPLLGSLLGSNSRLTSLPHMLLDIFIQVIEILLNLMMLINFNCELKASLDLLLSLLSFDEFVDFG